MSERKYYEDLPVGARFGGCTHETTRDEMVDFARQWDPRDIHLEDEAARKQGFPGLIASGAYTTAVFTKLIRASREEDGEHAVIAGLGADMKLVKPVRPGDVLRYDGEVVSARVSTKRPGTGILETLGTLTNQDGDVVYQSKSGVLIHCRESAAQEPA